VSLEELSERKPPDRWLQVIQMLAKDCTAKEISEQVFFHPQYIHNIISFMVKQYGVSGRIGLVLYAYQKDWIKV
jgi:DNA-binding NarL/FixJ family response regulator